jgi:hypothetical protein
VPFEAWTFRLNLSDPGRSINLSNTFSQDALDDLAEDARQFIQNPNANISNTCRLTLCKLARIGADGKYVENMFEKVMPGTRGGGPGLPHPPQCSLAISLNTDRRGASGRGRFYLPGFSGPINADTGLMEVAQRVEVESAVTGFLQAVNNAPGLDDPAPRVVVASTKGFNSDVTSFRVGRAVDTIRSRRASLEEAYGPNVAVS